MGRLPIDYYLTLGVSRDATLADLKKAYRALAIQWHPDRNPGSHLAEERFKALAEAYAVLSHPDKRRQYNKLGPKEFKNEFSHERIFKGFEPENFFKLFGLAETRDALDRIFKNEGQAPVKENDPEYLEEFFAGFGQTGPDPSRYSPNISIPLVVSFREAALGANKFIAYNTSSGAVKVPVTVPPASQPGQRLTLKGQGPSDHGYRRGDIVVTLTVTPDPAFTRLGFDLKTTLKISPQDLAQGTWPLVTTLGGLTLRLTVPPGSKSGTMFKIPGHGLAAPNGAKGDLLVQVIS